MLRKTAFLWFAILSLFAVAGAQSQTIQFSSEAETVSGTVTKCMVDILFLSCATQTINPVYESTTAVTGSNSNSAPQASQVLNSVEIYNFATVNNYTSASSAPTNNNATAYTSMGAGRLLQGLVSWNNAYVPLACSPDANAAYQVNCASTGSAQSLTINGIVVPASNFPAGTSFPVSGLINDPSCLLGLETFDGVIALQESTIAGLGTNKLSMNLTGMHLTGSATCMTLGLIKLFSTQYELKIAAPHATFSVGSSPDINPLNRPLNSSDPDVIRDGNRFRSNMAVRLKDPDVFAFVAEQ